MSDFIVRNPDYAEAVRRSFSQQGLMASYGVELTDIGPGAVDLEAGYSDRGGSSRSAEATPSRSPETVRSTARR